MMAFLRTKMSLSGFHFASTNLDCFSATGTCSIHGIVVFTTALIAAIIPIQSPFFIGAVSQFDLKMLSTPLTFYYDCVPVSGIKPSMFKTTTEHVPFDPPTRVVKYLAAPFAAT